jgi:feruloyl esterase
MPFAAVLSALALGAAGPGPAGCTALAGEVLAGGQVLSAQAVTSGFDAPPFCRVRARLRPSAGSQVGVEIWLPLRGWDGRYVQLGTGGFAGTIPEAGLAAEVRRGSAAAVTDTGHRGADGFDASWAAGAPERVIDYGYRSLKVSSDAARALTTAFYGRPPNFSYFVGCSNGGRQGLMMAQRYPDAFDGVLAGAPALRWTGQLSSFAWTQQILRSAPGALIPASKLAAIQAAAIAACRPEAGIVDGVPTNPRACRLKPEALLCAGAETDRCLTPAQVRALAAIQDGARDPATGAPLSFGFEATSAATPGGWDAWIVNPDRAAKTQLTFAEQFFSHMALGRPGWRVEDLRWPRDLAYARALAPTLDAVDPDLGRFRRRGGKLLIYAGWADPVISPLSAVDYYEGLDSPDAVRLFMVPGMLHCQGGIAPNAFGQAPVAPALRPDRDHDIRRALEAWVEHGRAPERLIAAKYVGDDPHQGIAATRTLRAFRAAP